MRIALVSDCYHPTKNGVTGIVALLADGLRRRGHEVTLIVPAFPRTAHRAARGPAHDTSPAPEVEVAAFPRPDVEVASLPLFPSIGLRVAPSSAGRLAGILQREGIEIVHTHTEGTLGRAARNAALRLGIPTVHTLHTLYGHYLHYLPPARIAPRISRRALHRVLGRFLAPYDQLVAPSARAFEHLETVAPTTRRVLVPNGVSSTGALPAPHLTEGLRRRLGLDDASRIILYVGRVAEEKRSAALFDAFAARLRSAGDVTAVLVGGGGQLATLRARARQLALDDRIRLPGYLDHAEVLALYRLASVFVTTSLSENHPLTLLEASAAGLPLAVRSDARLGDVAGDGLNAVVAGQDQELIDRAIALLDDRDRLARLGCGSRRTAARFSGIAHVQRTEQVYRRVALDAHGNASAPARTAR